MKDTDNEDAAIRIAASIMGKKGGKIGGARRTEKQLIAHSISGRVNIKKANAALTGSTPEETREIRRAVQMKVPIEVRIARAKKANAARNANRHTDQFITRDRFMELTADKTAQEIADAVGATYSQVISWRRKTNPVRIGKEFAEKIEAEFGKK